ncbi:hypothetical protein FC96_GL001906 [Secundilactobacillus kimchicus JCM 15530]|uniref:Uncharacterized protein n=1 Tax=Secundilactobacillus kimchicus JCM 15530 TaxID=1302272 RepID=A0A0R1HXM7_9LACO|nr:hypothetical protein [Secundilactobacillus kimchicus]KRK48170.1 hypothetical protein FC96_GL001906 [Secundilactobacillus kimchicus JCM 15530]
MSEALANTRQTQPEDSSAMSLIMTVKPSQVTAQLKAIKEFQNLVQNQLIEGKDFGIIPGTGAKPTLLKPGAEKILMLMGVQSEYAVIDKVENYDPDNAYFDYTVKCTLLKDGKLITEGLGNGNTREKKNQRNSFEDGVKVPDPNAPFDVKNTVLKMAKKRAQVDATLTIGSLSDLFTQDIEDMSGFDERAELATMTYQDALKVQSPMKKSKGTPLGDLVKTDRNSVQFLADKAYDKKVKAAAKLVLSGPKSESPRANRAESEQPNNINSQQTPEKPTLSGTSVAKLKIIAIQSNKAAKQLGLPDTKQPAKQVVKEIVGDDWDGNWGSLTDDEVTKVADGMQAMITELEAPLKEHEDEKQTPPKDPFADNATDVDINTDDLPF